MMLTRTQIKKLTLGLFIFYLAQIELVSARVIFVDSRSTNSASSGASWDMALNSIQDAVNAALDGDQVWVAAGVYGPVGLKSGVALYGGFDGSETEMVQRNLGRNSSIIVAQNVSAIICAQPGTNTTRIDGFVLKNGSRTIYLSRCSPVIANNTILGNSGIDGDSGIMCDSGASPKIQNNRICFTSHGIFCYGGAPIITGNVIIGNRSISAGAGILCLNSSPIIDNNRILGNELLRSGPGTPNGGIAISCGGKGSARISGNLIADNNVPYQTSLSQLTAAVVVDEQISATILNNTIVRSGAACAILTFGGPVLIANNIIAWNTASIEADSGVPEIRNNCFFSNGTNEFIGFPSSLGVNQNFAADPKLRVNETFADFRIRTDSPCRDTGDSSVTGEDSIDLDGEPRVQGTAVDIGADEWNPATAEFKPRVVRVSPTGNDINDGSSWYLAKRTIQSALDVAYERGAEIWVQGGEYLERLELRLFTSLYGGFDGTEDSRDARDWKKNSTVIDGQQGASVITAIKLGTYSGVDGFVIRNGKAEAGGGIYCRFTTPNIVNNMITNNIAKIGGGIALVDSEAALIANNSISRNIATMQSLTGAGGGIYLNSARPRIVNNLITDNVALADSGGGIACGNDPFVKIVNNTLLRNQASMTFVRGVAVLGAGAIDCRYSEPLTNKLVLANNLIAYNSSGILTSPENEWQPAPLANCFFGNTNFNFAGLPDQTGTNHNIMSDPLLDSDDLHLRSGSSCIDAGVNSVVILSTDFDGNLRIQNNIVDIGVSEHVPVSNIPLVLGKAVTDFSGIFRFRVDSAVDSLWSLQESSDFKEWLTIMTNRGPLDVAVEMNVGVPRRRFYRTVLVP